MFKVGSLFKSINKKLSKVPCSKHRLESAQDKRGFMFFASVGMFTSLNKRLSEALSALCSKRAWESASVQMFTSWNKKLIQPLKLMTFTCVIAK